MADAPLPRRLSAGAPLPRRLSAGAPLPRRLSADAPLPRRLSADAPLPRRLSADAPLPRRLAAEALGTGLLVAVVVGSGIAAASLSPDDVGLQLLENALATAAGLAVIILLVGPVSGAHLNPAVSLADWWTGRRAGTGLPLTELLPYIAAQVVGGLGGAMLANLMYGRAAVSWSTTDRAAPHLWLSEVVATAGLVALVLGLSRSRRSRLAPVAVGAYIGAAYWFTASTSFANPAVTVSRAVSDTFAGIAPSSVPAFLLAQLVGVAIGIGVAAGLYPAAAEAVPHDTLRRTG